MRIPGIPDSDAPERVNVNPELATITKVDDGNEPTLEFEESGVVIGPQLSAVVTTERDHLRLRPSEAPLSQTSKYLDERPIRRQLVNDSVGGWVSHRLFCHWQGFFIDPTRKDSTPYEIVTIRSVDYDRLRLEQTM
jgi:hypothetical protein